MFASERYRSSFALRTLLGMTKTTAFQQLEQYTASRAEYGPVFLRLGLGAVFLAHAYAKLAVFTLPGTAAFFEANGFPGWTAYPVLLVELLGGLSLLIGFQVRWAAAVLLPVMAGALVPHLHNGWMFTNNGGGWEYVAFLILALLAQVFAGPGRLSAALATSSVQPRSSGAETRSGELAHR